MICIKNKTPEIACNINYELKDSTSLNTLIFWDLIIENSEINL